MSAGRGGSDGPAARVRDRLQSWPTSCGAPWPRSTARPRSSSARRPPTSGRCCRATNRSTSSSPATSGAATHSGLRGLRIIRDEVPAVMEPSCWRSARPAGPVSCREVVGAGALDLFDLPVADDALVEGIDRAIAHRRALAPAYGRGRRDQGDEVGRARLWLADVFTPSPRLRAAPARRSSPPTWPGSSPGTPPVEPASSTSAPPAVRQVTRVFGCDRTTRSPTCSSRARTPASTSPHQPSLEEFYRAAQSQGIHVLAVSPRGRAQGRGASTWPTDVGRESSTPPATGSST